MREQWDGDYLKSDGQWMIPEDAREMANALEELLEEIPEEDEYEPFVTDNTDKRILLVSEVDATFWELFSGPAKQYLIAVCSGIEPLVLCSLGTALSGTKTPSVLPSKLGAIEMGQPQ